MAKDYDKIAKSLGAVDYDALAAASGASQPAGQHPVRDALLGMIPTSLGIAGGIAGGAVGLPAAPETFGVAPVAGAVAGAGIGGHLGRNIVSAIETATGSGPTSGLEAAKAANAEAVHQAQMQAAGELLGPAVSAAAKPIGYVTAPVRRFAGKLMDHLAQVLQANALNPGDLVAEMRQIVRRARQEGIPISGGMTMKGADEMAARHAAARTAEDDIAATASKWRLRPSEVLAEVEQRVRAATPRNKRLTVVDSPEWQQMREQFLRDYSEAPQPWQRPEDPVPYRGEERPFNATSALTAKRAADVAAFEARNNAVRGQIRATNQGVDPEETFQRTLGDVLRDRLRIIPGLKDAMLKSRDYMILERAYLNAEKQPGGLAMGEGGVAKSLIRATLGRAPMSRAAMRLTRAAAPDASSVAMNAALADPLIALIVKNIPRATATP